MPEGTNVEISAILTSEPLAVETINTDIDPAKPCDIYDTTGRYLGSLQNASSTLDASSLTLNQGIYILRQGNSSMKIILK